MRSNAHWRVNGNDILFTDSKAVFKILDWEREGLLESITWRILELGTPIMQ